MPDRNSTLAIGAHLLADGVRFRVWAPDSQMVDVVLFGEDGTEIASHPLERGKKGYYSGMVEGVQEGENYMYRLDGERLRPDPASRYQPDGVHGPSQVVALSYASTDSRWRGLPLEEMVIYEAHVGTATPEGTFEGLEGKLSYLKSLGITTLEIMPVGDFPGGRNWGYDGVDIYAPARAYGGPYSLKKLVDAAHSHGIAVMLDVVYNHLGPDGNYLRDYSRDYFTHTHKTPWGDALNYANPEVRDFFISNALYWLHEYGIDGLRLDATHAILDDSEAHFLAELAHRVRESTPEGRRVVIISEDHRNEVWLLKPPEMGGAGHDGVWADDFHHIVRSMLAGDNEGYYMDYAGTASELAETLRKGWLYTGQYSRFMKHLRGTDASGVDLAHFVYFIQNHDQIGNRPRGNRLTEDVSLDAYRAASALLLLSPYTPLIFQGQEWAASTPFLYFTSHNEELGRLVTEGRRKEFEHFKGFHGRAVPDPQALNTFEASRLNWNELEQPEHAQTLALYKELLRLRRALPALRTVRTRDTFQAEQVGPNAVAMRYLSPVGDADLLVVVNLKGAFDLDLSVNPLARPPDGMRWDPALSTEEPRFGGSQGPDALRDLLKEGRLFASGPIAIAFQPATPSHAAGESTHAMRKVLRETR